MSKTSNGGRKTSSSFRSRRDRVVAVFTTGQLWQFKQYKWHDPKELFRHGESAVEIIAVQGALTSTFAWQCAACTCIIPTIRSTRSCKIGRCTHLV